jgi:ribosomal protein S18 acetylase RimI-like enzyme
VVEDRPQLLRTAVGLPVTYTNQINAARLSSGDADAEIAATEAFLDRHGVPGMWVVGPLSEPEDLGERLVRRGWVYDEDLPWMAASISTVLEPGPQVPAGLMVEAVEDDDAQDRWLSVMADGFGMNAAGREAMSRLASAVGYGPTRPWRRFVGSIDGRPVGTAGLMVTERVAGVYNVATIPDARRLGVGAAMTAVALREGRARGFEVAVLGASTKGYGVYRRMGFAEVCRVALYDWKPPPG